MGTDRVYDRSASLRDDPRLNQYSYTNIIGHDEDGNPITSLDLVSMVTHRGILLAGGRFKFMIYNTRSGYLHGFISDVQSKTGIFDSDDMEEMFETGEPFAVTEQEKLDLLELKSVIGL
jgi:hypothetical protein